MKLKITIVLFFIIVLITAGCTSSESDLDNNADLTVYTSIYPIQYVVERIGGETVYAESVYPPGVDAHTYEPAAREMTAIADGDASFILVPDWRVLLRQRQMHWHHRI